MKDCPDCQLANQIVIRLADDYAELAETYLKLREQMFKEKIGGFHRLMKPKIMETLN